MQRNRQETYTICMLQPRERIPGQVDVLMTYKNVPLRSALDVCNP